MRKGGGGGGGWRWTAGDQVGPTVGVEALGKGFDLNHDTRLLYCKGSRGRGGPGSSTLVEIDQENSLFLDDDDGVTCSLLASSPPDRRSSGILSFPEMVEYLNMEAGVSGNFALGSFNSAFGFSGSIHTDAAATKTLCVDGYYVPLAKFELERSRLVLRDHVKHAVPNCWDPSSLASFIQVFGTHVITSVTIGGMDVIYIRQHRSSPLSAMEIKTYVDDIANRRFSDPDTYTSSGPMKLNDQAGDSGIFNCHGIHPQSTTATSALHPTRKEDVTVIYRRRGGDDLEQNHTRWLKTVQSSPDVIEMTFVPITDLLDGTGTEHLARAIGLYLEYKPHIEELRYFLEFQIARVWAPVKDRVPGSHRKEPVCPALQFSMMGQKLYVTQEQISVGRRPVTGLRLSLEGAKQNRICIHVQHLAFIPKILLPYWDTNVGIGAPKWHGPEEQDSRWFEPVKWKNFSHVSTAPIENPETFICELAGDYIVTGAQLGVWDFGSRNVLYMKLLYSRLPGCTIRRSSWDHTPNDGQMVPSLLIGASGDLSSSSSENFSTNKLAKFIDMSVMSKGPQDHPGHWLVTGGKLGVEKGKIVLRVKYSLLSY